jgi:hypothetical protein
MSGTVAGLGDGVAGLAVGDEVIGLVDFDRDGAAAEYVVMPAAGLAAKPPSVSHVAAATLPLAALTAWQALADHAALHPGEQVLVQGGAGGVGLFAVQLAGILGGHVTATGHSTDAGLVRDLGAERFIGAGAGRPGWPHLGEPLVRYRGQYCHVAALLPGHREPTPILRLRYQGSADHWAIGIYKASTGQYSETELPGSFGPAAGTPEQGIDDTFILYAGPRTGN